jgi:hypothetical protein
MRNLLSLVLGGLLLLPASAAAGPLYGTVRMGQAPVQNVEISVACPGFDRPAQSPTVVRTDERGSFSMRVPASGRCEMRVQRGNQTGSPFEVLVSNNPLRFDFEINSALNRVR